MVRLHSAGWVVTTILAGSLGSLVPVASLAMPGYILLSVDLKATCWIVPKGTIQQVAFKSTESKMYPGIAKDATGTNDPNDPAKMVVTTHPAEWSRTIRVYTPAGYVP